jgi:hypothetical protein
MQLQHLQLSANRVGKNLVFYFKKSQPSAFLGFIGSFGGVLSGF